MQFFLAFCFVLFKSFMPMLCHVKHFLLSWIWSFSPHTYSKYLRKMNISIYWSLTSRIAPMTSSSFICISSMFLKVWRHCKICIKIWLWLSFTRKTILDIWPFREICHSWAEWYLNTWLQFYQHYTISSQWRYLAVIKLICLLNECLMRHHPTVDLSN